MLPFTQGNKNFLPEVTIIMQNKSTKFYYEIACIVLPGRLMEKSTEFLKTKINEIPDIDLSFDAANRIILTQRICLDKSRRNRYL